jgi:hypothetical protein
LLAITVVMGWSAAVVANEPPLRAGPARERANDSGETPTAVANSLVPAQLVGTWNVIVKPGMYDGCGILQQTTASQWLVSEAGEIVIIRVLAGNGGDIRTRGFIDRRRVIVLGERTVQLAVVTEHEKARSWFTPGERSAREAWLLTSTDGTLRGTLSLLVDLGTKSDVRFCLVEQEVTATRQ